MVAIDFFVHPEHPKPAKENLGYANYETGLRKALAASEFPVLVLGSRRNGFERLIPREQTLDSAVFDTPARILNSGFVVSEQWDKFIGLLRGKEDCKMTVHGSYFGMCTQQFALQLYGYLFHGEHWFDTTSNRKLPQRFDYETQMETEAMMQGEFLRCEISFGIVFSAPRPVTVISPRPVTVFQPKHCPKGILKLISRTRKSALPYGNTTFQLCNPDTVVHYLSAEGFVIKPAKPRI